MSDFQFLTVEQIKYLHNNQIDIYGGAHGIRDESLLISAVEAPKATYEGNLLHNGIFEVASAYLYYLVQNHSFIDGNKRTGAVSMVVFLIMNGYNFNMPDEQFIDLVLCIASGKIKKDKLSEMIADWCVWGAV